MNRNPLHLLAALFFSSLLAGCAITAPPTAAQPATRPATPLAAAASRPAPLLPGVDHVLIISIDGLRPDLLLRIDTPVLHRLVTQGSFTFWARTTAVAVTLPSHVSMLTGVPPQKHGVEWNRDLPFSEPVYPLYPTLFETAKHYGLTTAMAAGKGKFDTLAKPGTIDWLSLPAAMPAGKPSTEPTTEPDVAPGDTNMGDSAPPPDTGVGQPPAKTTSLMSDPDVANNASAILRDHKPDVMFVHFGGADLAGHQYGWGSAAQVTAIEGIDACVGQIVNSDRQAGLAGRTLLIVTADHGGAGRSHGADDDRSRHIPWITVGPGVRKNFDLTTFEHLAVNTEDTFATACAVLGIRPLKRVDGKPIKEIVDQAELMQSTP